MERRSVKTGCAMTDYREPFSVDVVGMINVRVLLRDDLEFLVDFFLFRLAITRVTCLI